MLEILGAVCLLDGGHTFVLKAMGELQKATNSRFRFVIVVDCLEQSSKSDSLADKELQVKAYFKK